MNQKISTLLLISSFLASGSLARAHDLIMQTRIDQHTTSWLIDKTRVLMTNNEMSDGMKGETEITDDATFSLSDISQDQDFIKLRDTISSVFKTDMATASIRIRVPKVGYEVQELHAKPIAMSVTDPTLNLNTTAMIRGLNISLTQGIDLDLMIVNPKTKVSESYLTAHLKPTSIQVPNTLEPITFDVEFETKRDEMFTYTVKNQNLSDLPLYVVRNFNNISVTNSSDNKPISADSINVNPVTIRLNKLTRTVEFNSYKAIIQKRMNQILSLVFTNVGKTLETQIGPQVLKTVFSNKTTSSLIVQNSSIYTKFLTSTFAQPTQDQLYLGITGELCTAESYQQHRELCAQKETTPEPVRSISDGDRRKAYSEITESIARGDSDVVLSLSEEYMNRLLTTTIKANLWNESLAEQDLEIGPKGAFMIFNKRTAKPELYLDVYYLGDGKGLKKIFVNERHPLRFPLRISTSMSFEIKEGVPHMILKTEKVISTQNEIINGIPEYDLNSKLVFGFKRKIARMILDLSSEVNGQIAVDLDLPMFKNVDLEKTTHQASPFGRLNLFFKL